jgi:hypothetical protein
MERERGRAWEVFWRGERGMENLGVRRWEVDLWLATGQGGLHVLDHGRCELVYVYVQYIKLPGITD